MQEELAICYLQYSCLIVKPPLVTFNCFPFDLDDGLLKCRGIFLSHVLTNSDRYIKHEISLLFKIWAAIY